MKPSRNGFALAGLAAMLCVVAACSNGPDSATQGGNGRVQFVMSATAAAPAAPATSSVLHDGPPAGRELQAANVTFASILARNLDGELIDVTVALPVTVDLLGVVSGGAFTLPAGFLPPGTYDQVVIVMTKVALTLADGTVVTIEPPGGGWTAVIPVTEPFTVVEGQTTEVTIKFSVRRLLRWLDGKWDFHPEFECEGGHRGGGNDH